MKPEIKETEIWQSQRQRPKHNRDGMREVNLIGRHDDQSEISNETEEHNMVLHLEGKLTIGDEGKDQQRTIYSSDRLRVYDRSTKTTIGRCDFRETHAEE